MQTIRIEVFGNYARSPAAEIVCGNSDYFIEFAFSAEWNEHTLKTARFFFADTTIDKVFEGNVVQVPIVKDSTVLEVGVYAGNLRTTTPALIGCKKSILCREGAPEEPAEDVYNQIIQMIEDGAIRGESAFDVAVKNGFEGTEEEWLASLKGEKGGLTVATVENEILAIDCAIVEDNTIVI